MSMENARTVLLADPDEKRRTAHRKMLRGSGFEVLESGTIQGSRTLLESHSANLFVCWFGLPGGSTMKLCWDAAMEDHNRNLRIVVVTGHEIAEPMGRMLGRLTHLVCRQLSSPGLLKEAYRLTGLYEESRALDRVLDQAREARRSRPVR